MAIEEPKYTVIEKPSGSNNIELRAYEAKIIAEVTVSGTMDEAGSKGFKLIADYIFGNNTTTAGANKTISMTAPVAMKPAPQKISMTAPVTLQAEPEQEKEGKGESAQEATTENKQWRMHFVMPSEYSLETLPKPNNPAVTLREIPAKNYAAIRFSGFTGEKKVAKKTAELITWLEGKGILATGEPELARYNPPWTLPFWRRNEIIIAY